MENNKLISIDKSNIDSLVPLGDFNFNNYCKNGYLMIPLKDILSMSVDEEIMSCENMFPTIEVYIKMYRQKY